MRLDDLAGRRVVVLGHGREGRAAANLIGQRFPDQSLHVYTGTEPVPENRGAMRFHAGLPAGKALAGFDVAIRSPGISPYKPPLSEAPPGLAVITGTGIWFAEHPGARAVVVTGTKGKSTTASLIAQLLKHAGRETLLAGNIGVPLLECMAPDPEPEFWVIELSSYQIKDLGAEPGVAVYLNLHPEHLDWHGSVERYYADKLSLLSNMTGGTAVINRADAELCARLPEGLACRYFNDPGAMHAEGDAVWKGGRELFPLSDFNLKGAHNRSNLCAALTVLDLLGLDPARAGEALPDLKPLPHRLQTVATVNGIEYVDDSISTTPGSALAAAASFPGRPVTLLLGGYDRGLDWSAFAADPRARALAAVVTFGAQGRRIASALRSASEAPEVQEAGRLEDAVARAREITPAGGVVLLSPGAPSFDAYTDYAARGDAFAAMVGGRA